MTENGKVQEPPKSLAPEVDMQAQHHAQNYRRLEMIPTQPDHATAMDKIDLVEMATEYGVDYTTMVRVPADYEGEADLFSYTEVGQDDKPRVTLVRCKAIRHTVDDQEVLLPDFTLMQVYELKGIIQRIIGKNLEKAAKVRRIVG